MSDFLIYAAEFFEFVNRPATAGPKDYITLSAKLDTLTAAVTSFSGDRDSLAYEYFDAGSPKTSRESLAQRFSLLGHYNIADAISKEIGLAQRVVGDALDDLLDTSHEIEYALTKSDHTSALACAVASYYAHWGLHARALQLYLLALDRDL